MTLAELIERIKIVANEIGAVEEPRLMSPEMIAEVVLPRVFQIITQEAVANPHKLNSLRVDSTIALTAGVGTLPEGVDEEYAEAMYIKGSGVNPYASLVPQYMDYETHTDPLFPIFCVTEGKIYYSTKETGNITLSAIKIPQLPTLATDTVVIDNSLLEQVIALAAGVIRGEVPLVTTALSTTTEKKTSVG